MFSKLSSSALYRAAALVLITGAAVYLMILGKSIIIPLAFAAFAAVVLAPLCQYLENKGIHRSIAAFLCLLLAILVSTGVTIFFTLEMSTLANGVETFENNLNNMASDVATFLGTQLSHTELTQLSTFQELMSFLLEDTQGALGKVLVIVASSFVFILFLSAFIVMFLIYRKGIREFAISLFQDDEKSMRHLLLKIEQVVRNYLIGIFQVIVILAVCNCLALWLLGVPNPIFFGIFAALLNIVPFIGPLVGSLVPAMFAWVISGSIMSAVWIIIYFIVIQSLESYAITPNIVGNKVNINPMFTLLAIFIGNLIWGVPGMILFIPLTAVLKQIFNEVAGLRPYAHLLGALNKDKAETQDATTATF